MKPQLLTAALCFALGIVLMLLMGNAGLPDSARYDLVPCTIEEGRGTTAGPSEKKTCFLLDRQSGDMWQYKTVFCSRSENDKQPVPVTAFYPTTVFRNDSQKEEFFEHIRKSNPVKNNAVENP